jgi:hypothetical protein
MQDRIFHGFSLGNIQSTNIFFHLEHVKLSKMSNTQNKTLKEKIGSIKLGIKLEIQNKRNLQLRNATANAEDRIRITEEIEKVSAYIEKLEDKIEIINMRNGW